MRHYLNDGSTDAPKLRVYLNLDNLADLRPDSVWPGLEGNERMARLRADGFDGVQVTSGEPPSASVMPFCGLDRINAPAEALSSKPAQKRAKSAGQRTIGGAPLPIFKKRRPALHDDPKIILRASVQGNL